MTSLPRFQLRLPYTLHNVSLADAVQLLTAQPHVASDNAQPHVASDVAFEADDLPCVASDAAVEVDGLPHVVYDSETLHRVASDTASDEDEASVRSHSGDAGGTGASHRSRVHVYFTRLPPALLPDVAPEESVRSAAYA